MVVEIEARGDALALVGLIERTGGALLRDQDRQIHCFLREHPEQNLFKAFPLLAGRHHAALRIRDKKRVQRDAVRPGETLRTENVDPGRAE